MVIDRNLKKHHISRDWLIGELAQQSVTDPKQVTYAVIDSQGKLFINPKKQSEYH